MYAIIQIAGKQFKVKPGMVLNVPTLNVEPGKKFDVERVLAYSDGKDLAIGTPELKDITIKGIWVCIVQLELDGQDKPHPDYGLEVGRMIGAKYTVVVGPDIDINNLEEVLWAIGTRAPRNEWVDLPQQLPGKPPIPRYGVFNELTTDMGFTVIDATIPAPGRFDTFPPRTEPPLWEREAISRMRDMLSAE